MFEERLTKASVKQPAVNLNVNEELPPAPSSGAPNCGLPSGDRLLMTLVRQVTGRIDEIKNYLQGQVLPEEDAEAERVARQAKSYCLHDGDLYRKCPKGVALRCVPAEEGRQLIKDIHSGECGHHSSSLTLAGKVFRSGFYWPSVLQDAAVIVQSCDACQFHAKQTHQPAQGLDRKSVV